MSETHDYCCNDGTGDRAAHDCFGPPCSRGVILGIPRQQLAHDQGWSPTTEDNQADGEVGGLTRSIDALSEGSAELRIAAATKSRTRPATPMIREPPSCSVLRSKDHAQ